MNYRNLVRRPFDIVARRPYLWLLGLLAGGATSYSSWSGNSYRSSGNNDKIYSNVSFATLQTFWNNNWEWIVWLAAIALVVSVVLFILGCIATGGIIRAAVAHDEGREYGLGTAWRAGYSTGWRIAGLRLTTLVLAITPAIFIAALAGATAALATTFIPAAVILALVLAAAALASVAFWIVLGVAYELAQRIIVLEDGPVFESLAEGFRMVRWHLKETGLGWGILVAISIAAGIAMGIVAVAVAVPAAALGFSGWLIGGTTGVIVLGSFAGVFFLGVVLAAIGLWSAYSSVYWTLLYRVVRAMPLPAPRGAVAPA
ncbi:MAG TPA: hypothetical protein VFB69_00050 [Candidatus Dormibacteraeota bacterium]|nr:hypothetical protein [Candidatus Dormibacteraeota bacterium]